MSLLLLYQTDNVDTPRTLSFKSDMTIPRSARTSLSAQTQRPSSARSRNSMPTIDPKEHEFEYYDDKKKHLLFEVEKLRKEVDKLREKKNHLKQIIIDQKLGQINPITESYLYTSTKCDELDQMREDSLKYSHKIDELKETTNYYYIDLLKQEIKAENVEVEALRTKNSRTLEKLNKIRSKIFEYQHTEIFTDIENQRYKIKKLKKKIHNKRSKYIDRKIEMSTIEPVFNPEVSEINFLQSRLIRVENDYKNISAKYMQLRRNQIEELRTLTERYEKNKFCIDGNCKTIVISGYSHPITTEYVRAIFSPYGEIESICTMSSETKEKYNTSVELTFKEHESAVKVFKEFNGSDLAGNNLRIDFSLCGSNK